MTTPNQSNPSPASMPGRTPKPGPRPGAGTAANTAAASTTAAASGSPKPDPSQFGRVDEQGTVYVTHGGVEREIGSWQAGAPEEGLAHFGQRFDDIVTEVELIEHRLRAHPEDAANLRANAQTIQESLPTAAAIGDFAALESRLESLIARTSEAGERAKEAKAQRRADAIARKEALAAEAEELAEHSTDWKAAGDRIRDILEEWRTIRGIDRKPDDALWKRYSRARDSFNRRRGSHFAELDRGRASAKRAKEELVERASQLAEQFGAHAVLLSDIPDELAHSDIVISSTASQLPILGKGAVEQALKRRKHKPMFMVDIAVPRDIEPQVGELDDVYLYTVDDLHEVVAENLKSRQGAAQAAEELVAAGTEDFMQRLRELAAVDVLKAYRQHAERIRDDELSKAQRLLANGASAEDVLAQLARGLTNKLLHAPSVQLKKLSAEGRVEALSMAQELFALHEGTEKT